MNKVRMKILRSCWRVRRWKGDLWALLFAGAVAVFTASCAAKHQAAGSKPLKSPADAAAQARKGQPKPTGEAARGQELSAPRGIASTSKHNALIDP